jgi:hypothetical protein
LGVRTERSGVSTLAGVLQAHGAPATPAGSQQRCACIDDGRGSAACPSIPAAAATPTEAASTTVPDAAGAALATDDNVEHLARGDRNMTTDRRTAATRQLAREAETWTA